MDLAKEAAKKDRLLIKQREQSNLHDQINLDLTYTSLLHLAHVYEALGMLPESLNTYNTIVKNKAFTQAGKLRVNMGNIYFKQGKYAQSIKMYRIALDQIPSIHHDIRIRVTRNIGNAFVKMQKYQDAVVSYESILESQSDFQTAYNLVLSRFALGEKENMKRAYSKLSNIPPPVIEQYTDLEAKKEGEILDHDLFRQDALRQLAIDRRKKIERYILFATKCIAPVIEESFAKGYDWTLELIRSSALSEMASELEIAKAMEYLKVKDYHQVN